MDDEIAMIVLALSLDRKPVMPENLKESHEADIRAADVWHRENNYRPRRFER